MPSLAKGATKNYPSLHSPFPQTQTTLILISWFLFLNIAASSLLGIKCHNRKSTPIFYLMIYYATMIPRVFLLVQMQQ